MTVGVMTIGHSNHAGDVFHGLLAEHAVAVLIDVRSAPYSRFHPQFNRAALARTLAGRGIEYVYLGNALGGRPASRDCYEDDRVRYDRVARTETFQRGLDQVLGHASRGRTALMCAEREPLACHRTLLIAPALDERGVEVAHILADGSLEAHAHTMDRLLASHGLAPGGDLLDSRDDAIATAIRRATERAAFRRRG